LNINSDDEVGLVPELIYADGIDKLLDDNWQFYSIIPLFEKVLVTVISGDEAAKIGTQFSGASALHCQAGQRALTGFIVKANPVDSMEVGGKKRKSIKKRNLQKKTKKVKAGKKRTMKKSKKQTKSRTKK